MRSESIIITVGVPCMTPEKFATESGLRAEQVRGQLSLGHLDKTKIGKLNMVNLVALTAKLANDIQD